MSEQVTVYGTGDLRVALESVGATQRQLSYLVTAGAINPSVRMTGRLGYTASDLALVFLMLGPLASLELEVRRRLALSISCHVFGTNTMSPGTRGEFEVDLEDTKKNRPPAVRLKIDAQELRADFAAFMGRVAGVSQGWLDAVAGSPEGVADLTGKDSEQ